MAVLITLPTLTCPHVATSTHSDSLSTATMGLPTEENKKTAPVTEALEEPTTSPTSSEPSTTLLRRSSEAEIEARLARIPGHVNHCDTSNCALDPERLARLRKAQGEAMAELKGCVVFRPSSEMAAALAEIERRRMWEDLRAWE